MTTSTSRARPAELDDRELMSRAISGDVDAFEAIYDRYCDEAYRVALSVCHDHSQAQEAVQDGFLSVWRSRANYQDSKGTVAAWVLTLVHRRAIDLARSNARHRKQFSGEDQSDPSSADDVFESAAAHETAKLMRTSLATLPDDQAEVIVLAYYGQLSHTEIASQLGLSSGTVKGRMRLGMQKLRAAVEQ